MPVMVATLTVALRRLKLSWVFTFFAVITLGAGIGVTTAFYSVVMPLVSPALGVEDVGTLATVGASSPLGTIGPAKISWPDIQDIASQARSIERVAGYTEFPSALAGASSSGMTSISAVSGKYFGVLGVRVALGRAIQPDDDRVTAEPVTVISEFVWRSQFGGERDVIGTTVKIAGRSLRVVGVAPKEFRGVGGDRSGLRRAWVPLSFASGLDGRWQSSGDISRRTNRSFSVVARLAPGASYERATAEVGAIAARLNIDAPVQTKRIWQVLSVEDADASSESREVIWVVLALPVLVLIVACTNLANLVVSRGVVRQYDLAVRSALGASRLRLILDELVEPVILAVCGGLLGLGIARAVLVLATSALRAPIAAITGGEVFQSRLEPEAWGIAGAATLLSVIVFGIVPAIRLTSTGLQTIMMSDNPVAGPRWRIRRNVIALQVFVSVALSLLTLVGYRYVAQQLSHELEVSTDMGGLLLVHMPLDGQQYGRLAAQESTTRVVEQLRDTFGAGTTAIMSYPPFSVPWPPWVDSRIVGTAQMEADSLKESGPAVDALLHSVAGDYFRTLSYRLLGGRFFDERDSPRSPPVVILNERLARDVYGSTNAVGRTFHWKQSRQALEASQAGSALVVGVAGGPQGDQRVAFMPFEQRHQPMLTVMARTETDGVRPMIDRLRSAINRADPDLAIQVAGPARTIAGGPTLIASFLLMAVGALSVTVLVLSMSGLYGVLSQVVTQRRREMGLRLALGADKGNIVRLVIRNGMAPVFEGCLIGVGIAAVLRQVFQIGFHDELSMLTVGMLVVVLAPLLLIATATCYLPARRASRADPNVVLREL